MPGLDDRRPWGDQMPPEPRVPSATNALWPTVRRALVAGVGLWILLVVVLLLVGQELLRGRPTWDRIGAEEAGGLTVIFLAVFAWARPLMAMSVPHHRSEGEPGWLSNVLATLALAAVLAAGTIVLPLLPNFPSSEAAQDSWTDPTATALAFLGVAIVSALSFGAVRLLLSRNGTGSVLAGFGVLFVGCPIFAWWGMLRLFAQPVSETVTYLPGLVVGLLVALAWAAAVTVHVSRRSVREQRHGQIGTVTEQRRPGQRG